MEKIAIIDDDNAYGKALEVYLSKLNYTVYRETDSEKGLELIQKENPDLVITDLRMPRLNGIEVLKKIKSFNGHIQVMVMTAYDDMETTIEAMQAGAYDYLDKTIELQRLRIVIERALESKSLSERLIIAYSPENVAYVGTKSLVGKTPIMNEVFKKIGKISSNKVNVLIQGESGTGKELIAKIIHFTGVTKGHPFIAVNCSALSEALLESELFGHEKGSFTGAIKSKKGKFELAGEGTIFLDEISELSLHLQVKLLRVIQEKEFDRVGSEATLPMKARIIAATNQDLSKLIEKGKFREDLFYRLNVFSIKVPPLRERKEDIPILIVHFLRTINNELHKNVSKIPFDVMEMLQNHNWVGNVRELENTLMQGVVLANGDVLEKEYILLKESEKNIPDKKKDYITLAEMEKEYIKDVLNKVKWNKNEASKILGIAKTTLYNKIEFYNLTRPEK